MSDDSSSSSPARTQDPLLPRPDVTGNPVADAALDEDDVAPDGPPNGSNEASTPSRHSTRDRRRKRKKSRKSRNPGLVKKLALVSHLLKTLDIVAFAEMSALYYMEPDDQFVFLLVLIPNIVCMLLHLLGPLPEGPDYYRGYQHGGIIIDFVGQKPATWRVYYLAADLAILFLQCLMLTIHTERERLRIYLKTFRPRVPNPTHEVAVGRSLQDLDAEEQGILMNADPAVVNETNDVEMQALPRSPENRAIAGDRGEEAEAPRRSQQTHLLDVLSSGNGVLGGYNILESMRVASLDFKRVTAFALQILGYEATRARLQAQRHTGS
ncbi:DSC E3 ubiquitin ligase complex subunit [Paramyrothecium foliicola]|nr:DSC E3 ubiquitin ligase complex subunit [Paramyrothecium foliicola]